VHHRLIYGVGRFIGENARGQTGNYFLYVELVPQAQNVVINCMVLAKKVQVGSHVVIEPSNLNNRRGDVSPDRFFSNQEQSTTNHSGKVNDVRRLQLLKYPFCFFGIFKIAVFGGEKNPLFVGLSGKFIG